jgi:starch phosphorylase
MAGETSASQLGRAVERTIAYFSMEIGLDPAMPTYAGGLGVLAGDTVRSAADLKLPLIAVSLLHRKGYFYQRIDPNGWQIEQPVEWVVQDYLQEEHPRAAVTLETRRVVIRAWRYDVRGAGGFVVPVYLLDTDLPENSAWDRELTHYLYGGDTHYRLCQEIVLGVGGLRMLRALGFDSLRRFHMNEGHASLLALELLDEQTAGRQSSSISVADIDAVRQMCVFTTHTPVPAGHDQFPLDLVARVMGKHAAMGRQDIFCCEGMLNMTFLALNLSGYVNGVAKKHGEVSRHMFARYEIDSITNGVHAATWTAEEFQRLFDEYVPGWREDNFSLRYALSIPIDAFWAAHERAKRRLISHINRETNVGMDTDHLTLGFARRATPYKRMDLLLSDAGRLREIVARTGPLQIVFAGKAHPRDQLGKEMIQRIAKARQWLHDHVKIAYLENYDMDLGRRLTGGVDVWVNTPEPPLEASGTSGMKAALNGVPSLSVLDGWWIEGCIEGVTGWAIGMDGRIPGHIEDPKEHGAALYRKLEETVAPLYYHNRDGFIEVMRHAIALNGSFFNTQRMLQQYVLKAYF